MTIEVQGVVRCKGQGLPVPCTASFPVVLLVHERYFVEDEGVPDRIEVPRIDLPEGWARAGGGFAYCPACRERENLDENGRPRRAKRRKAKG